MKNIGLYIFRYFIFIFVLLVSGCASAEKPPISQSNFDLFVQRTPKTTEFQSPGPLREMGDWVENGAVSNKNCKQIENIYSLYILIYEYFSYSKYKKAIECSKIALNFPQKNYQTKFFIGKLKDSMPFLIALGSMKETIFDKSELTHCSDPLVYNKFVPTIILYHEEKCLVFGIDTGAPISQISNTAYTPLEKIENPYNIIQIKIINIKNKYIKNAIFMLATQEQSKILKKIGGINGVIGLDLLKHWNLRWHRDNFTYSLLPKTFIKDYHKEPLYFNGTEILLKISNNGKDEYCVFDTGSTNTLISQDILSELGISTTFTGKSLRIGQYQAGQIATSRKISHFDLTVAGRVIKIEHARERLNNESQCVIGMKDLAPHDHEIDIIGRGFRWL